ncbi:MAG: 16S rRNA (uracil(1498)-N(3))-methyltransferase [Chitinivibrionales bacterium]|nr:16S rRNA (uracil(1498)-N(3))-methyltransferase [Chitinivibrionales bacterium]
MNLILVSPHECIECGNLHELRVTLHDHRFHHIRTILASKPGDTIKIGILNGAIYCATVEQISDLSVSLTLHCPQQPPPALPVTLICALPRPKVMRRVVQNITAMGVKKIYFIRTWRVEQSYWQTPFLEPEALTEECIEALQQSGDTIVPHIQCKRLFKPFLEDEIDTIIQTTTAYVAHPYAPHHLPFDAAGQATTIALGPEGGFLDYEIDLFQAHGFLPVTLGRRILKVEYALSSLIGRLYSL